MKTAPDILIFSDDKETLKTPEHLLARNNYLIHIAPKDETGFKILTQHKFDLIIVELSQHFSFEMNFIDKIYTLNKFAPIVIMPAKSKFTSRESFFSSNIVDYVGNPFGTEKLFSAIMSATEGNTSDKLDMEKSKKLVTFYEISKCLTSVRNFNELLDTIVELVLQMFKAARATVFIIDDTADELYSIAGTGLKKQELRFPKDKGIAGTVFTEGISVVTADPYSHPAFNKKFDLETGFKTKNIACVPLKDSKGKVFGCFEVLNKLEGEFSSDDEIYLSAIASNISVAIENYLLQEKINILQNDAEKLYDTFYETQKKIISDSKKLAVTEIIEYMNEIKQYDAFYKLLNKLKELLGENKEVSELIQKMTDSQKKLFIRIDKYLQDFQDQV